MVWIQSTVWFGMSEKRALPHNRSDVSSGGRSMFKAEEKYYDDIQATLEV